ncbi:MAG: hypothetical protein NZO16_05765 [Deltaproteobacteria bacterium]|nr:hypothetical protein [Deltaproteobacteria bacterium]
MGLQPTGEQKLIVPEYVETGSLEDFKFHALKVLEDFQMLKESRVSEITAVAADHVRQAIKQLEFLVILRKTEELLSFVEEHDLVKELDEYQLFLEKLHNRIKRNSRKSGHIIHRNEDDSDSTLETLLLVHELRNYLADLLNGKSQKLRKLFLEWMSDNF